MKNGKRKVGRPRKVPADHEEIKLHLSPDLMAWVRRTAAAEMRSMSAVVELRLAKAASLEGASISLSTVAT